MKILQVITRMDSIGGAQRHVVELSRAASEQGHEIHLAYGGEMALAPEELTGIILHPVPSLRREISPWKDACVLVELRALMRSIRPDLVATHSTKAGILGRYAAWMTGIADVHTVHGWSVCFSGNKLKRFLYSQIEGKTHRLADGIICVSEFDRKHAMELGLKASKLKLIYNGRPDAPGDSNHQEPTDPIRVVSVGRLAWPKLPGQLLHFLEQHPGVHLDLVGSGPDEQKVRDQADQLGVSGRVSFHGHVDNIYPILTKSHIFALVSDWEGFPMSTLEAMSVGLPTVVSGVGGAGEAIENAVTGYVVPRGDEQTLHIRLAELVENDPVRREMGARAKELFERKFRSATTVEKTLEFYAGVLAR